METNHSELRSSSGIYRARCAAALTSRVERYIDAVDSQFEVLKRCFGMEPQIQRYQVEFAGEMTCYKGSGEIAISANDQNLDCNQPECFEGGLVFETIHCFLEPLRHPPHGIKYPRIGGNRLGESFSTIIEICFLERIGAHAAASRYKGGAGMGKYHHPLLFALVEI